MILLPEQIEYVEKGMRKRTRPAAWQKVFENTLIKFKDHILGDLINARYIKGQTVVYTCAHLQISKALYFKYREAALNAFMAGLIQEGVLKLYE